MTDHQDRAQGAPSRPAPPGSAYPDDTSPATARDDNAGDEPGRLAELGARLAETEDRWRRALADLDNFRKRVARDHERQLTQERARTAAEWLPVLDNLDLALTHATADPNSIVEGVRAVRDQALAVMARLGFPRADDEKGTPFDPARHEAVGTIPLEDAEPGAIVEVVRPGYGDEEHLLRPAAVVVAARPQ